MVASTICFAAGVITVLLLPVLSKTTYISENALMPGLPEFTPNWRQFSWCTAARIVQSLTWFTHLRYTCFVGSLFVCKHGKMQLWIFAINHLLTGVEGCRFWGHFACLLKSDFWLILWGSICSPCYIVESLQCILCLSVVTGVHSEIFLWGWQTLPGCRYTSGLCRWNGWQWWSFVQLTHVMFVCRFCQSSFWFKECHRCKQNGWWASKLGDQKSWWIHVSLRL